MIKKRHILIIMTLLAVLTLIGCGKKQNEKAQGEETLSGKHNIDIEVENYDRALAEIFAQLDAVRAGDFTDDDLEAAKRCLASDLRAALDSPGALESYWLSRSLLGLDYDPAELAALIEEVERAQVIAAAQSVVCDAVYFLRGTEAEDDGTV